ncbi:hypothetical protein ACPCA8_07780 [Streptomyces capoamus]|uniref:hypothetical protein n=1 Tax=Streptomyces capoamus TaxID=68183 RepID=UPI003C2F62B3
MAHLHALIQARARHIGVLEALSCPSTADLCVGLAAMRADPLLPPELLPEPWPAPGGPRR